MTRLITLLFTLFFLAIASLAHAADPFTVVGVPVDATADTVIEAQTEAMQQGQLQAAQELLNRVTLKRERQSKGLPTLTNETVGRMIRAMTVDNEKRSSNRYLGEINVAFNPREVQSFVQKNGLTLISSQSRERLVLPVENGSFTGYGNWAQAWSGGRYAHALTPVRSLTEIQLSTFPASGSAIANKDMAALKQVGAQYGVQQILIAELSPGGSVAFTDVSLDSERVSRTNLGVVGSSETAIAGAIMARLENDWKSASTSLAGEEITTVANVLYRDHSEWTKLQGAINTSAQIKGARLDALSKDGALMTITYGGDMERLRNELRYKGVEVRQDPEMGLVLAPTGRF